MPTAATSEEQVDVSPSFVYSPLHNCERPESTWAKLLLPIVTNLPSVQRNTMRGFVGSAFLVLWPVCPATRAPEYLGLDPRRGFRQAF